MDKYNQDDLIRCMHSIGLYTSTNRENYVYPITESAKTVVEALQRALSSKKINVLLHTYVESMTTRKTNRLTLKDLRNNREYEISATKLIIATGGKAFPKTGGKDKRSSKQGKKNKKNKSKSIQVLLVVDTIIFKNGQSSD